MVRFAVLLSALVLVLGAVACSDDEGDGAPTQPPVDATAGATGTPTPPTAGTLSLMSSAFQDGGAIPEQYTCEGAGMSPPLTIAGVPADAEALALIMVDTSIGGFVHWTLWNVAPTTTDIPENTVPPAAVQGANGGGSQSYLGPCPTVDSGPHTYEFTLYALDQQLTLEAGAPEDALVDAMRDRIVGQTTLAGTYNIGSLPTTPQ